MENPDRPESWASNDAIHSIVVQKARKASNLPDFNSSDQEDIQQEFWLHLLNRLSCYDPSRASPETFASRLLDNHVRSLVRSARAEKRSGGRPLASINQVDSADRDEPPLAELVDDSSARRHLGVSHTSEVDRTDERLDVREVIADTSPSLQMLAALLSHVPQFAAGEVIGLSRRRTAALVAKLRDLFEAAGLAPDVQISAPPRK